MTSKSASLPHNERRRSSTRARAPLRLGIAGGGTDLSPYSDTFGGAVLNCTIDRYAYAFIEPHAGGGLAFHAKDLSRSEAFDTPDQVYRSQLALHRGVYLRMIRDYNAGRHLPLSITTSVDAPMGSGLGSSSALVIAMVEAFRDLLEVPLGQYEVAHLAFEIERIDLQLAGGKQDQYASSFGGMNFIEFLGDDRVIVNPLRVPEWIWNELESSMVIAFTGQSRASATIIEHQRSAMLATDSTRAIDALHQLKADAIEMKSLLLRGDIPGMGRILAKSWAAKKATSAAVSNARIDQLYDLAVAHGAMAGKVSGAGGGGFMMFIVPPELRLDVVDALNNAGARASPVKFVQKGCETWRIRR
jgi:D-glycero-alpha-D-manno-heptose-7-phosphate kinase